MNIVFIGSRSFVASELIKQLKKKNNVICFSRSKSTKSSFYFDLLSKKNVFNNIKNIKKIHALFFFSSYVPLNQKNSKWEKCNKINILGLINFISKISIPVNKIILSSSCSVYGKNEDKIYRENCITRPDSYYAISKFAQELILNSYCKRKKIQFLSYRLGYVFGEKMNPKRIVKKLLIKLKNKQKIKLFNIKKNLNLIHTELLSNIIIKSFKKADGIYNLTHKFSFTLGDLNRYFKFKKKNIVNKINNYSMLKMKKKFPKIKFTPIHISLNKFIDEN